MLRFKRVSKNALPKLSFRQNSLAAGDEFIGGQKELNMGKKKPE
jgi:hypothetical protein